MGFRSPSSISSDRHEERDGNSSRHAVISTLSCATFCCRILTRHKFGSYLEAGSMGKLAITGGDAVRSTPFPVWPLGKEEEARALEDVLDSSRWGGQPFPGKYAAAFAKKFAATH